MGTDSPSRSSARWPTNRPISTATANATPSSVAKATACQMVRLRIGAPLLPAATMATIAEGFFPAPTAPRLPSADIARDDDAPHPLRAGFQQRTRAGSQCGAGRTNVVHEQDPFAFHRFRLA